MTINAIIKTIIVLSMFYDQAFQYCPHCPPGYDSADSLQKRCDGSSVGGGSSNANADGGCENPCGSDGNNNKKVPQEGDDDYKGCGQYGFRCIDPKTYEICPGPPLDDDYPTKEEPIEHVCGDGLNCDEDNPAYCSPMESSLTTQRSTNEGPLQNWVDDVYFNDYMDRIQKLSDYNDEYSLRVVRSSEDERKREDCGCSSTESTEMTTIMTTTITSMETPPQPGAYECESYGFHADRGNNSLFWYCDVPDNGVGYIIKHMSCGEDRIFDSSLNTCVKIGTTRNIRNEDGSQVENRCAPPTPPPSPTPFSCKNFPPGKYKDDNDCSLYHICFSNKYFPLKEVTIACPHNMVFDAFMKKCTHKNGKRCSKNKGCGQPTPCTKSTTKCTKTTRCTHKTTRCTHKTTKCTTPTPPCSSSTPCSSTPSCSLCVNAINCESPIRFRDVSDCSGYFLCYADNVIHMNCPESFKFDDSYHDCMPDRIARCTEEM